jgi:hypothetical protein
MALLAVPLPVCSLPKELLIAQLFGSRHAVCCPHCWVNEVACSPLLLLPLQILDETSAAVAALEAQQWRASTERSLDYARSLAAKTAVAISGAAAAAGLQDVTVTSSALLPEGGASDVGASVCKYAQEHKVRSTKVLGHSAVVCNSVAGSGWPADA